MKRCLKALGAFSLTLALALTLWCSPLGAVAQAAETEGEYAGYLVILDDQPVAASFYSGGEATLMAAYNEREELLPLAEDMGIYKTDDLDQIQNLVWSGQVLSTEPDYKAELFDASDLPTDHLDPTKPNDPYFIEQNQNRQYNLKDADAYGVSVRAAWDAGLTGEGVTVAVIDSGLNGFHSDVPAKVARGRYYFYREEPNGRYQFTVNGVTKNYNYYSNDYVQDDLGNGHGTMVSGIIAANKDNGIGIAGAAPGVTLMPVRCFTNTQGHLGGYVSNLISGVTYAMNNGANIINMSWGIANDSAALRSVITQAANKGCILIAAVGNDGNSKIQYPAAWDNVIGVGATDKSGYLADYSQRNDSVAVCAPGSQIWSLSNASDSLYRQNNGTSFSAPLVAACAALLKEADPTMTQADFVQLLQGNCDEIRFKAPADRAYGGTGIINLRKMLDDVGYAGATMTRSGDTLSVRAAYHPVQGEGQAAPGAVLMLGAYNAQGHLLDSQVAIPTLSGYGAYSLLAQFDHPDVAALRAFYLKNDGTLAAVAAPAELTAR